MLCFTSYDYAVTADLYFLIPSPNSGFDMWRPLYSYVHVVQFIFNFVLFFGIKVQHTHSV